MPARTSLKLAGKAWLLNAALAPAIATGFSLALSATSGLASTPVTVTVTPFGGVWPAGETITFNAAGLTGSFSSGAITPQAGTTTPASVLFTPSSGSGTINASAAPSMSNVSGAQPYTVTAQAATSYTLTQSATSGVVGQTDTLTLTPTPAGAVWPAVTLTLAGDVAGTFTPSASVTPTQGSSAAISAGYTPSASGTAHISVTNNGGLNDPTSLTYAVSASSGGTAGAVTPTKTFGQFRPFQRDTTSGNPTGFTTTWNKGWGAVSLTLNASAASSGLFIRLYDATPANNNYSTVTPGSAGTGTLLQDAVQVFGSVVAGVQTVSVNLPAGPKWYWMDVALDAGMTNAVRIQQCFGVGAITAIVTRSYWCGFGNAWAYQYQSQTPADLTTMVPFTPGASFMAANATGYSFNGTNDWWQMKGNVTNYYTFPPYEQGGDSTAGMRLAQLMCSQLGVVHGLIGVTVPGGDMPVFTTAGGAPGTYFRAAMAVVNNKFRYFLYADNGGMFSYSHWQMTLNGIISYIRSNYPTCKVIGLNTWAYGAVSNGSGYGGNYFRLSDAIINAEASSADVVWTNTYDQNQAYGGHPTMLNRIRIADAAFRFLMARESTAAGGYGTNDFGPTFTGTGHRDSGGTVLKLPFVHHGSGTSITTNKFIEPAYTGTGTPTYTETTASGTDLVPLFTVRLLGQFDNYGRADSRGSSYAVGAHISLSNVEIHNDVNEIWVYLDQSSPGNVKFNDGTTMTLTDAVGFTAQYVCDAAGDLTAGTAVSLVDNRSDATITRGWAMRAKLDIDVPGPGSTASLGVGVLGSPRTFATNQWLRVTSTSLTGAGAKPPGVQIGFNGGSVATPAGLVLRGDGSYWGYVRAPAAPGTYTMQAYQLGSATPDSSTSITVASRSTLWGSGADAGYAGFSSAARASILEYFDVKAANTLWQDATASRQVTDIIGKQSVFAWDGAVGGLRLTQPSTSSLAAPTWDPTGAWWHHRLVFEAGQSLQSAVNPAIFNSLTGDFTIMSDMSPAQIGALWWIGSPNFGIQVWIDGNFSFQAARGNNAVSLGTGYNGSDYGSCVRIIMRYTVATGLLETWAASNVQSALLTAASATAHSKTVAPGSATLTLTGGTVSMAPPWGGMHSLFIANSAFAGTITDTATDLGKLWQFGFNEVSALTPGY